MDGGIAWPAAQVALPHSYDAEQGLLGALLTNNRALERIDNGLLPEHFADPLHSRIFEVISETIDKGQLANPVTLARRFEGEEASPGLPVGHYLVKLARAIEAIVNAEDYARTIKDAWARRSLITACQEIISEALAPPEPKAGEAMIEDAESRLCSLTDRSAQGQRDLTPIGDGVDDALARIEAAWKAGGVSGLSTGLADLDKRTGGLQPGSLIILGGRPGMGKSDLALNIALAAAEAGKRVGFFSLEMSRGLLINRALARLTKIPATNQIGGKVSADEIGHLSRRAAELKALPLAIDDSPAPTVDTLLRRAKRMQRRQGLDLVVVDYLQLVAPGNTRKGRQTNRTEDVTMISQGLKALAKDLEVPVIALCQLSRQVEMREDKRPQLPDLRESGGIEQDADVVLFVYREAYYLERDEPKQRAKESYEDFAERRRHHEQAVLSSMNLCEAIIAKQRMAPVGTVNLFYKPAHSTFGDLDQRGEA